MASRRGRRIRVPGVTEELLRLAVAAGYREPVRRPRPEDIDLFLMMEFPDVFRPLAAARGVQARHSLYRRLRPRRLRAADHFPTASIGAVAVVTTGMTDTVTHEQVVARAEPSNPDPIWWRSVVDRVPDVVELRIRRGVDYATIVAVVNRKTFDQGLPVFGAVQGSSPSPRIRPE